VDLSVRVGALTLRSPLLLASGFLDETAESMLRVWDAGAGGVVTKSIGKEPRRGHPNPSLVPVPGGYLNAMGLPNPGIDHFEDEVKRVVAKGAVCIGSIFGGTDAEFQHLASRMDKAGAQAIELNVSCPHAQGYGTDIGCSAPLLKGVVSAARAGTKKPLWVKLAPNVPNIAEMAKVAVDAGADGLTCINTLKAISIDVETGMPRLGNKIGGFSGPGLKAVGVRAVWDVSQACPKTPVIGVGGIMNASDVVEYLMAGASAVQLGSVLIEKDLQAFTEINRDLETWCRDHSVKRLSDLTGAARAERRPIAH
jgi:dihydroorotate dehydrogenase (NAD+) catalytic subunit